MGAINLILWVGGAILLWFGYARARGPWARYQDLKAQDANVARYEAWRGGIHEDSGPTGASVAMAILRRQVQVGAGLGIAGLIAIVAGFVVR
jgi:threonine/homoserine/homoserine lactone efflux protein